MSIRERIRHRVRNMRAERRQLAYELVAECRDCQTEQEAENVLGSRLDELRDNGSLRFGLLEIIAIVQLCLKIWAWMKEQGWLEDATPSTVKAAVESDD